MNLGVRVLLFGLLVALFASSARAAGDRYVLFEPFSSVQPPGLPEGWALANPNGGAQWESRLIGGDRGGACVRYLCDFFGVADDWLFSPPLDLTAGTPYFLSFLTRTTSPSLPHTLFVWAGTTTTSLTVPVVTLPAVAHTDVRETTATFTVGSSGAYYLGFHCASPLPSALGLYLDNVTLSVAEPDLRMVLQLDKAFYQGGTNTYTASEPKECLVYVENTGSSPVVVNRLMSIGFEIDPDTVLSFRVTGPDGLDVPTRARFKPGVPTQASFVTLQPGEIAYKFYDLAFSGYSFEKTGPYVIQAVYKNPYRSEIQSVWRGELVSDPATLVIQPEGGVAP